MLSHTYPAKSCGSTEKHGQHIWVGDGRAYACFGHTPITPKNPTRRAPR